MPEIHDGESEITMDVDDEAQEMRLAIRLIAPAKAGDRAAAILTREQAIDLRDAMTEWLTELTARDH